jgi:xanthine dehydrogenase molybdenum-binding subunit
MAYKLIGKDFTPPDVLGKVTGKAKYAEDFRAEGMLFCKILSSPMPHARVRNIDASEALKMDGVLAVLTADDVPAQKAPLETILTNEPTFVGDPILAVAAVDETTASDALEKIKLDLEPLPYTLDPLQSLYPGGDDAREDGNVCAWRYVPLQTIKWTARDFAAVDEGQLPMGKPAKEWNYGDVDKSFAEASLVIDESFVVAANSHHSMEPRSAMAYWQNGKCFMHVSSQSQSWVMPEIAAFLGIEPKDLVLIAENCGGGFGSKGTGYPMVAIPAYLAKKTGRPVMLRVTRAEEYAVGKARVGFQGRVKLGFRKDGRVLAVDLSLVHDNGPTDGFADMFAAGDFMSLMYQPESMRFRGIPVLTNTPPRRAQRGPGQNQMAAAAEPLLDRAARELGIDRVAIRKLNAAETGAKFGPEQEALSTCYQREALATGAEKFNWEEKKKLSGKRRGSKVIGVGVGQAFHPAGFNGFDGLVRLSPEGKLHIHSGVGNLGTYSHSATSRVAAEVLKCDWDACVIERGDSRKHLPFNIGQFGSNTSFTMSRTNYVAAMDAMAKLKEIAAMDLGGNADDYDIGEHRVFLKSDPDQHLTYAAAAQRAIELGGKFSGHEAPEDIHPITKAAVAGLAGSGLIGVAKDNLAKEGKVVAIATGYMTVELDTETGKYEILDYVGGIDCGTVVHPQSLATQIKGGAVMGIGMAGLEQIVYDPQNGLPANVGFYQAKPPSYLDVPPSMDWAAVGEAERENPLGIKGMGEPVMGCASAALLCAISDAMGGHVFNRTPVRPDMIVNALAGKPQSHKPLQIHTQ